MNKGTKSIENGDPRVAVVVEEGIVVATVLFQCRFGQGRQTGGTEEGDGRYKLRPDWGIRLQRRIYYVAIITHPFCTKAMRVPHCPACRTTLVATRFWVVMICPIIKCLTVLRVFFYFVWFVFIHHNFQFYFELCTYCNILDIYLS